MMIFFLTSTWRNRGSLRLTLPYEGANRLGPS
jgi:hypothetical protein